MVPSTRAAAQAAVTGSTATSTSLARAMELPTVAQLIRQRKMPMVPPSKRHPAWRPVADRVALVQGDITRLEVDAIVNAANRGLKGGGGVDGAIHAAAGPELLAACKPLGGCETGDAKVTPGFQLPAKYVVHTVGPVYNSSKHDECEAKLRSAYRRSLEEACKVEARTVAFPSISTGIYGYPKEKAVVTAAESVADFLSLDARGAKLERVVFCAFSQGDAEMYLDLLPYIAALPTSEDVDTADGGDGVLPA